LVAFFTVFLLLFFLAVFFTVFLSLLVFITVLAKEIARQFDVAACTVAKRLSCAMFKLGVNRQTAAVAEAMRRQIISPMCITLAALIAMHAMIGDDALRRDRRAPDRRTAQVRMVRQSERPTLTA
jgi:hypothetical protein